MSKRIPDEKIEQIRQSVDIVEVISDYVQLKKQGRNYLGLCPFHGEKTPSFSVSTEKQLYHCFGCGAGGNVFTFIKELEGVTFIEAVSKLAERGNISLPEFSKPDTKTQSNQAWMMKAHDLAAKYYFHLLHDQAIGEVARTYLKNRGFTKEMVDHFGIGFAPESWNTVTTLFEKRGVPLPLAEQSGLLGLREFDKKYFDRFRNRIMFPIWDGQGKVIAFGGRIIGEGQPKYLNSPESPIFNKGNIIYGLHLARPYIRKENQVVLFEGYVDVISAWKADVKNGVATLGTALTMEQAKIIRRNAETVIICYDSDNAGVQAAFRAASTLEEVGCHIKVATLPEGLDPDDYVQKYGNEKFKNHIIHGSLTLMAFKMQFLRRGKNLQDEGERMRYIEEVISEITELSRAVEREHYLRQLSEEFSLSLEALKQEQHRIFRAKRAGRKYTEEPKKRNIPAVTKQLLPAYQNAERRLLAYMMKDPPLTEKIMETIGGAFNVEKYQAIAAHLYAFYNEGKTFEPSDFIQRLEDDDLVTTATEIAMMEMNDEISEQELLDYIKEIENYPKRVEIEKKEQERMEAERQQDIMRAAQIGMEIIQLKKALKR